MQFIQYWFCRPAEKKEMKVILKKKEGDQLYREITGNPAVQIA